MTKWSERAVLLDFKRKSPGQTQSQHCFEKEEEEKGLAGMPIELAAIYGGQPATWQRGKCRVVGSFRGSMLRTGRKRKRKDEPFLRNSGNGQFMEPSSDLWRRYTVALGRKFREKSLLSH